MNQSPFHIVRVSEDHEFELLYDIRSEVFQDEYDVAEEDEVDGNDHIAHHYLVMAGDLAAGTARWRISLGGKVRLERIAVRKQFRGTGAGRTLMTQILQDIPQGRAVYLLATLDSVPFYEKFGFVPNGEPFEEVGVMQQEMNLS